MIWKDEFKTQQGTIAARKENHEFINHLSYKSESQQDKNTFDTIFEKWFEESQIKGRSKKSFKSWIIQQW